MKIAVLGDGWLGRKLATHLGGTLYNVWVNNYEHLDYTLRYDKPEVVVNAIGHTGKNVDECELNKEKTLVANSFVPFYLAEWCIRNNAKLVHLSSGCIFNEAYEELPNYFELFYSRSKIYSDMALSRMAKRYGFLVLRIRVPLDVEPHPKNILTKLIQYKKVINVANSITYIPDFLHIVTDLINIDASGTFNIVCDQPLYYPMLMDEYKTYRPDFDYEIVTMRSLGIKRTNIVLPTDALHNVGITPRTIEEVIGVCVYEYTQKESLNETNPL